MGHRKRFHSLSTCAVRRACAIASVCEQDRADGGSVRAITISVWIGIDDREHIGMLVGDIGVIASASLSAPIHPVRSRGTRNELDHLVGCRVDDRYVIRRIGRWAIDVRQRKDCGRRPLSVRTNRRLNWPLKRMEDVKSSLPIGCERDWDVLRYRLCVHVNDGDHATHQISNVSFVDVINVALADCDRHQERRS